ncbi:MAG: carboxypeptidase regulatory-like domain-containing protein, partial [Bacteroidota bacterium]
MLVRYFTIFIFSLSIIQLSAQATMRGSVIDADNGQSLIGATLRLNGNGRGTTTDSLGGFRFDNLQPGRYQVRVSYLGYEQLDLQEILVSSGKETVLDLELHEAATSLTAITVKGSRTGDGGVSPSVVRLTQEETLRFPASFNDPARLALAYPGMVGSNDQGNLMTIRGQSPLGMHWRLEGLEIVNPNHTPNAGTFSDRTTFSGGGVNALSSQLLEEARFYLGSSPATYGNATAGLLDMRLRRGNNEQREFTLQAGLIGIDLAAEGPIKAGGSSYLVNYRYSFTGLLADLGVPLGNEDIRFQDLSFKLSFPNQHGGRLDVFGLWGKSSNNFIQPADTTEWEDQKYLYNTIDFDSDMATLGFHWSQPASDKGLWQVAGAWSNLMSTRVGLADDLPAREWDALEQSKTSVQASYRRKLLPYGSITLGLEGLFLQQAASFENPLLSDDTQALGTDILVVSPYLDWQYQIKRLNLRLGWRLSNYLDGLEQSSYSEPRLSVNYATSKTNQFGAEYGVNTQAPSPYSEANVPRRARQWSLFWSRQLTSSRRLNIQLYDQHLTQLAGTGALSEVNQFTNTNLGNTAEGEGRTRGIEASLQQFATGGWWYLLSGTYFDARYRDEQDEWAKSRFARDFASSLTLGKEWSGKDRQQLTNVFGFNIAIQYNGGLRAAPINIIASKDARTTIFDFNAGFTEQLPAYFRTDLRI